LALARDLNTKHPFWNIIVPNLSVVKLQSLLHINEFEISAPHYSPAGNDGVLDIVVHNIVQLSEVFCLDILDSDHLPVIFHLLDYVRTRNVSDPADKVIDWEWFQSLASELFHLEEADKVPCNLTASIGINKQTYTLRP
jgi:hypothetical protein